MNSVPAKVDVYAELPDGKFSYQKWRNILEGFRMNDFYGHLEYFTAILNIFTAIWYILWSSGIFCSHMVNIFPVLVRCTKKNLATLIFKIGVKFWNLVVSTGLISVNLCNSVRVDGA
jgi:hypothetical protein